MGDGKKLDKNKLIGQIIEIVTKLDEEQLSTVLAYMMLVEQKRLD